MPPLVLVSAAWVNSVNGDVSKRESGVDAGFGEESSVASSVEAAAIPAAPSNSSADGFDHGFSRLNAHALEEEPDTGAAGAGATGRASALEADSNIAPKQQKKAGGSFKPDMVL